MIIGGVAGCSDHNDFSYKHVYTPEELEQQRIKDSIKAAQRVNYTYDLELVQNNDYAAHEFRLDSVQLAKDLGYASAAGLRLALGVADGAQKAYDVAFFNIVGDTYYKVDYTANGFGYWIDKDGGVCNWGEDTGARLFFELYPDEAFTLYIGQFPKKNEVGNAYTVIFGFQNMAGRIVSITFNITIV